MAGPRHSTSTLRRNGPAIAIACSLAAGPAIADPPRSGGEIYASREGIPLPPLAVAQLDLEGNLHPQDLYLEVFHGERPIGRIAHVRLRNGGLSATPGELRAIGLEVPAHLRADDDGLIPLDALPGLVYRYEPATQRLILRPPASLRPLQQLGYQPPAAVQVRRDAGWLLSYDAYGRRLDDDDTLAVATTLRRFGRAGTLELTGVSRAGDNPTDYERLDTRWTYSDPRRLWTWTAGDLISGGLPWTRPVRLGGLQWRRNFGVRPDLITLPMPRFSADATVPSSVELYVNNIRQFGGDVQDGPFVLDSLPRISGAGQASLIVTDALGRVTTTTVPLYVDHQRLAPGLSDFSLEAGLLRQGFGGEGDDYGEDPVVSASWRRGITETLTFEGHGEAGVGLRLAGVGGVWSPANRWGLITASYARSDGDSRGGQHTLGYQWSSVRYGLDVQTLRRSDGFRDLGDLSLEATLESPETNDGSLETSPALRSPRAQDRATFWMPVARGSVAATWVRWRDGDRRDRRTRSLSWTQNLGSHLSVSATLFDDDDSGRGGGLTLSLPLDGRLHAGAGVRRSHGQTSGYATLRRNAPYQGGWGWSVEAGDRPGSYAQAAAEVRGRYGEAQLGVDRSHDRTGGFFQGGGSLVRMDGRLFPSRRIHDAFAVVSTNGRGDVPVLSENRLYGRTDDDGYLLVPELRGWQRNRLAIDPGELGVDERVGDVEKLATPADRSGVLVEFEVTRIRSAVLTLLGPAGQPVPAGTRGRLVGTGEEIVVGFDGEAYVENLTDDTVLELDVDGVRCRYRVPVTDRPSTRVRREPLACERSAP